VSFFWEDKNIKPQEKNRELVLAFRKVFSTENGKIALNAILTDLHLFERVHTEKDSYLNEYAKFFIRERLGVKNTKVLTDFISETAVSGG